MLPAYDSGDHLHPNDAGMKALADAVTWLDDPSIPISAPDRRRRRGPGDALAHARRAAAFGTLTPGVTKDYVASTTANVISSAGNATLTVSPPGHLLNGEFALPQPLVVELSKATWAAPVSNDAVTVSFKQHVEATDALRTGAYSKNLVFTLSSTAP